MAKQLSDTIITGTFDNLVFYKMYGKGYVRSKSSLTGKQFKTQARFARSRISSERFATGNKIAGQVYRSLPASAKHYTQFTRLKSAAIALLKSGLAEPEVQSQLLQLLPTLPH